jgi:tRNA threonylcarbamoyladenosine biosynthesis protein TsaE
VIITRTSTSEEYTLAMGRGLADLLRPGDVVALEGQLGAGKTTLVRAIALGLRVDPALVASPTFVLVNQYPVPADAPTPLRGGQLVHMDAYRLHSPEDLEPLGWDQFIDPAGGTARANAAVIIEWADRIAEALPSRGHLARIELAAAGETARQITLHLPASWESREGFEHLRDREPTQCRVSGRWVAPTAKTYPFFDERSRDSDLYQWFTSGYKTSRAPGPGEEPTDPTD